jgi:hypothetical protein
MSVQDIGGVQFPAKTIRVLPFDMLRIAGGNPMAFETSDGERVTIRLFTAEEFSEEQHASALMYGTEPVTAARAEELTRPLNV